MTSLIFSALGALAIIATMVWDNSMMIFINPPSLVIVIGSTVAFTLAYHSVPRTHLAFLTALSSRSLSPAESLKHQHVISTARLLASASGVLGATIGIIHMLSNMDDPSKIGPAMAVTLLSILYAVMMAEVIFAPLINRLKAHTVIDSNTPDAQGDEMKISVITLTSVPFIFASFFIMLNSIGGG